MASLGRFGYDVRVVGRYREFKEALETLEPDVACVFAHEELVPHVAGTYADLTTLRPEAFTILGGYAALPSAANYFDIVIPGEGDLLFPLLLNYLLLDIVDDGKVPSPDAYRKFRLQSIPPEITRRLRTLSARRFLPGEDDWEIRAATIDIGARIYASDGGTPDAIDALMTGPREEWPIPINDAERQTMGTG